MTLHHDERFKVLNAAIEYATMGWHVFPLHTVDDKGACSCGKEGCGDAGKHPRVDRGLKVATRDLSKIEQWFGKDAPPSNIGIVTGEISGITVIDIDIGDGKFGAESWAEAIKDLNRTDYDKTNQPQGFPWNVCR